MIVKSNNINNLDILKNNLILFHGKNEGLKNEIISKLSLRKKETRTLKYDEKEIIENKTDFYNTILNESLFESNKLVIINRASDKLVPVLENLFENNISDILIIKSDILDKKSKLRAFFEKEKKLISVAFYPDTNETLLRLAQNFFKEIKIPISFENINIIVNRCVGDRNYLNNELEKIALFVKNKKIINANDLMKITNLTENYSVNELIDFCLSKNKKKTITILNENNFGSEDTVLIIRTFLMKSKRLLNLLNDYKISNDIDKTILRAKPPIFWKDKNIVKQQIKCWTPKTIKEVIYNLNKLEINIRKISFNPLNIVSDFILDKASSSSNN